MATRKKDVVPAPVASPEVQADDRAALAGAYRAGLILTWKRDASRGFCLSMRGRADEYVEPEKLARYLEKLKGAA
jgi:hypothetical protein